MILKKDIDQMKIKIIAYENDIKLQCEHKIQEII